MEHGTRQGLEWLLNEVEVSLKEAYEALEEYLSDSSGCSEHRLEACKASIHQVHGSLKLVEHSGPILLAEEMELLLDSIRDGSAASVQEASEVLVEGLLQLPTYLRQILAAGVDQPETLILLINEVRAARQQPLITETAFFSPRLDGSVVSDVTPRQLKEETFSELVVKLRQMYQHAVLGVVKNQKVEQNLEYLKKVFSRLHDVSLGTAKEPLWKIMLALLESIADKSVSKGMAVRGLLRQLDDEFAKLYQMGFQELHRSAPESLLKNLLFYVAWGKSEQPNAGEIRQQYQLDASLPEGVIRQQGDGLSALFDPDTATALVEAINIEIAQVKESLERYVVETGDLELLKSGLLALKRIGDSLAVAGRGEQRAIIERACGELQDILDLPEQEISGKLAPVADYLVQVETGLYAWLHSGTEASQGSAMEVDHAQDALVNEIREGLEAIKQAIIEFIASEWKLDVLDGTAQRLGDVAGALGMLGQSRAEAILTSCQQFLVDQLASPENGPDWNKLDCFADALTSIEYYLDYIDREDTQNASTVLASAEESVALLGWPIGETGDDAEQQGAELPQGVSPDAEEVAGEIPQSDPQPTGDREASPPVELTLDQAQAPTGDEQSDDAVDDEIIEIFLEEAAEVLLEIDRQYPKWVAQPADLDIVQDIRRNFHTLKGSGRMVGAEEIGNLAWSVENMLNKMLDKRIDISASIIALIDLVKEQLPGMIEAFKLRQPFAQAELVARIISSADAVARGEDALQPQAQESQPPPEPVAEEQPAAQTTGDDPAEQAESDQGAVLSIFAKEAEAHLATLEAFIAEQQERAPLFDVPHSGVQRALHTLRGSAKMAGIVPIGDLVTPLEKFFKELRDQQAEVSEDILALLVEAVAHMRTGITQIYAGNPVAIDDLDNFKSRLKQLRKTGVGDRARKEQGGQQQADPESLNGFMAKGMTQLLDADRLLQAWREQGGDCGFADSVAEELGTLVEAAGQAAIEPMSVLASLLLDAYKNIADKAIPSDEDVIERLGLAHQTLLNQMDCVAANGDVEPLSPELVEKLNDVAAMSTPEPAVEPEQETETADAKAELEFTMRADPEVVEVSIDDIDRDILETFTVEANELLEEIDNNLSRWKDSFTAGTADSAAIEALKRYLHTLKGGARMVGLTQLGDLSHELETDIITLEEQGSGLPNGGLSEEIFAYLTKQQDFLQRAAEHAENLLTAEPVEEPALEEEVDEVEVPEADEDLLTVAELDDEAAADLPQLERHASAAQEMIRISTGVLERLVNLAGETSIASGRIEAQISEFSFALEEMDATIRRLQDQVRRIGVETDAQVMFRREQIEASAMIESFDPLEMDRYSQLQQLSRGLLESASDLQDLKDTLINKARDAETQLLEQSRINADLQEGMMRTRMVPFSRIVPRLRRIVRQVADELGKQVKLTLTNADGEMDRSVMEQMIAPLEHMIRNAIDHGIEDADTRKKLGKPQQGSIVVSLTRQGGDILIQLADDGRGFDIDAIRQSAIRKGLMEKKAKLGDDEIIQFVFEAGFTTSTELTQVSGRGVGMDVVHHQVRALGGNVDIDTIKNKGSRFSIRLPFTVSINRALMVEVAEDLYAIPLNSIDGVVNITPAELETYYEYPESRLEYGGQEYEVCYLGNLLSEEIAPRLDDTKKTVYLVLVHSEKRNFAVQVDELLNNSEIVVKSIGPQFSIVPGLSGATVLGDGRVVVILDLLGLLRTRTAAGQSLQVLKSKDPAAAESAVPTVMVVDDSVTVRKVAGRFLEREGFNVLTAKNGIEAMKLLQDHQPDVMLLDIEMPLMDGFEVATRVKTTGHWKEIPIIMITSRSGEKHKERALSIGVEKYLGKPYQEEELLANINELVGISVS